MSGNHDKIEICVQRTISLGKLSVVVGWDSTTTLSSLYLHRDESNNDVVQHIHPSRCYLEACLFLTVFVRAKLSYQGIARIDDQLRFGFYGRMSTLR